MLRASDRRTAGLNGNLDPLSGKLGATSTNCTGAYDYDEANRIHLVGSAVNPGSAYSYAPGNKRVWRGQWDGSGNVTKRTGASRCARQAMDELTCYSAGGAPLAALSQKLVVYDLSVSSSTIRATKSGEYYEYFGGPPPRGVSAAATLKNSGGWVNQDRLGSIGQFFPYGQERPSATSDGKEKFATYFRDSETGLDYAQNRYHDPGDGRFMTTDPYAASAGPRDPGSWNRYAYTRGDPVNRFDPAGLQDWPCETADPTYVYMQCMDALVRMPTLSELGITDTGACAFNPVSCLPPCFMQGTCGLSQPVPLYPGYAENLSAAFDLAFAALEYPDGNCARLFNSDPGAGIPLASQVLSAIRNGTGYANLQTTFLNPYPDPITGANTRIDNATVTQISIYTTSPDGVRSHAGFRTDMVNLNLNTNPLAPFASNATAQDRAITLIHELGHVFMHLFGANSTAIRDDSSAPGQSTANTALVKQACFP